MVDSDRFAYSVTVMFVVDALNFCFWPSADGAPPFEYHNLAGGLKASVERNAGCIDACSLATLDGPGLRSLLNWGDHPLPQEEERAGVLRQTCGLLQSRFGGSALSLVQSAGGSASALVELITATFPAFRDCAIYGGRQISFFKRAQIFVGDVHGAFGGRGPGAFTDLQLLTMFADYRVPVVLRQLGILRYNDSLSAAVDALQEIPPGSPWEIEIRACSVIAVEGLRAALAEPGLTSVALDWALWEMGEAQRLTSPPHHRTRTIFY